MTEYILTEKSNLVAVANSVRKRTGGTGKITLGEMIDDINYDIGGVELPELTNEGTASDLLAGKQLIDQEGNIVEGTIATKTSSNITASGATVTVPAGYYATQATKSVATATQATPTVSIDSTGKITATATQTAGYVSAGTKTGTKQLAFQAAKTITPTTASQIAVSSGYYTGGDVTVAAVPTQSKTVTPTSSTQNITPDSGKFLSKVTVNGDSNLAAGNIKSGVSIFGVNGTYVGSGGSGDTSVEDGFVTRTLTSYTNDRVTSIATYAFYKCSELTTVSFPVATFIATYAFYDCSKLTTVSFPKVATIGSKAFYYCSKLTTISFPKVTTIGSEAFYDCSKLTTISFPVATSIGADAFYRCSGLTTVSFPKVTTIGADAFRSCSGLTTISFPVATFIATYAFYSCSKLTTVSFPKVTTIGRSAFISCYNLKSLYLTGSSLCKLSASNAFSSTPIGGYSTSAGTYGSIYVPASLLTSYKTATNWTYFSSRFVGI